MQRLRLPFALSLALLVLAACTSIEFSPAAGMEKFPPSQKVAVFKEIPKSPYITLGDIIARGDNTGKMLARIKQEALAVGAEAIILTPAGQEEQSFSSERRTEFRTSKVVMRAIAIRFTKH